MQKLKVKLEFEGCADASYEKSFDVQSDPPRTTWDYVAAHLFQEFKMKNLYRSYRAELPSFEEFSEPPTLSFSDTTLMHIAASSNTFEAWFHIYNAFLEVAHLLAQARAYHDVETEESEEREKTFANLAKIQSFNLSVFMLCKIPDLFLELLFVNSGCLLIPSIDVHKTDWMKKVTFEAISTGLKSRKPQSASNPYLDALTDAEYSTIVDVLQHLRGERSSQILRNYRNAVAHRSLPAVDHAMFSPAYKFPKAEDTSTILVVGGRASVEYTFLELYKDAVAATVHLAAQLRRIKAIPILKPVFPNAFSLSCT